MVAEGEGNIIEAVSLPPVPGQLLCTLCREPVRGRRAVGDLPFPTAVCVECKREFFIFRAGGKVWAVGLECISQVPHV